MSLQHSVNILRKACTLACLVITVSATNLSAQVPTNGSPVQNLPKTEGIVSSGHTIMKVMAAELPIPFGISVSSGNSALLDMKGNDQEFTRKFTFKNISSGTYTINSVDFEKHDNSFEFLSTESGEAFPMEIGAGETFTIRIAFIAKERDMLCTNTLEFRTEENKLPIVFPIQAMQVPLSALPWNNRAPVAQAK